MAKFDIDEALLRKLALLLQETGLTEIEYENNGQRIRVNRGGGQTVYTTAPAGSPASPWPGAWPRAKSSGPRAWARASPSPMDASAASRRRAALSPG